MKYFYLSLLVIATLYFSIQNTFGQNVKVYIDYVRLGYEKDCDILAGNSDFEFIFKATVEGVSNNRGNPDMGNNFIAGGEYYQMYFDGPGSRFPLSGTSGLILDTAYSCPNLADFPNPKLPITLEWIAYESDDDNEPASPEGSGLFIEGEIPLQIENPNVYLLGDGEVIYTYVDTSDDGDCGQWYEIRYRIVYSRLPKIQGVSTQQNTQCNPGTGSITINTMNYGSISDFTYTLIPNNGTSSNGVFSNLTGDNYQLYATNNDTGCSSDLISININDNIPLMEVVNSSIEPLTYCAEDTGSILNNGSFSIEEMSYGELADYSFAIISGPSSGDNPSQGVFTNLANGPYSIYATNNITGCSENFGFSIDDNRVAPNATIEIINQSICSPQNGALNADVGGLTDGYTFEWWETEIMGEANFIGSIWNNREAGTYFLKVTDNTSQCNSTSQVDLLDETVIPGIISHEVFPQISCSTSNGSISLTTIDVDTPNEYSYTWYEGNSVSGVIIIGQNTELLENLSSGAYTVVATHNTTGCATAPYVVNVLLEPDLIWYLDSDGDGLGDDSNSQMNCNVQVGYVTNNMDTDDGNVNLPNLVPSVDFIAQRVVQLSWFNLPKADSYEIDISEDNFSSELVGKENLSASINSIEIQDLLAGQTYQIKIRAKNTTGLTPDSEILSFITVPGEPVISYPDNISQTVFRANWNVVTGAEKYYLKVSTNADLSSPLVDYDGSIAIDGSTNSKTITGLSSGVVYYYSVKAENISGESQFGLVSETLTKPVTPIINTIASIDIDQTNVAISWPTVTGIVDDYQIEVSSTDFITPTILTGYPLTVNGTSINIGTDTGTNPLTPGTNYWIRIRSRNTSGESLNSNVEAILTNPATPVLNTVLITDIDQTNVAISWPTVAGIIDDYQIEVSSADFNTPTILTGYPLTVNGTSLNIGTDTGTNPLTPGTNYWIRIRSRNTSGESLNSNVEAILTNPTTPVLNTIANQEVGQTSITISWAAVAGIVDNYVMDVSKDGFQTFHIGFNGISIFGTDTIVTGLNPGTEYEIRLRSGNSSGESTDSNVEIILTKPETPVLNTVAIESIGQESVSISWPAVAGSVNVYQIEVSSTDFTQATTLLPDYPFTVTGTSINIGADAGTSALTPGTNYWIRVRSVNDSGESSNSNVEAILTKPATPIINSIANQDIGQDRVSISWPAVAGIVDNYVLDVSKDGFQTFQTGYNALGISGTDTQVTELDRGTNYEVRLRSENTSGHSANSLSVNFLTIPANPDANAANNPTSTSFQASWNSVIGADYYIIEISDNDFATLIFSDNLITQLFAEITDLSAATEYKYRVQSGNATGVSGYSIEVVVSTEDPSTPLALNTPTPFYEPTQNVASTKTVNFSVSGGNPPYTVILNHKKILESTFTKVALPEESSGNYSFEITPDMLDELGVEFKVEVTDVAASQVLESGIIYVSYNDTESQSILEGVTANSWNLFSIPFELDQKSVSIIFDDYDQNRHEYDWRIVRYQGAKNKYVNFNTGQLRLGEAYWFNTKEPITVKSGAGHVTDLKFDMPLDSGWNLIGNPYPIPISWNQVLLNNPDITGVGDLQEFNGLTQSTGDIISPFSGGFVFSPSVFTIEIDPRTASTGGRIASTKRKLESEDIDWQEWLLDLTIQTGNEEKRVGGFGMHPEASELKDKFDEMMVPRFFSYTDLSTKHDAYFYPWFATDVVPTASNYTWSFTLSSNIIEGISNLVWNKTLLENKESGLYLLDKSSGKLLDMKSQSNYSVDLRNGDFKFDIYFVSNGESFMPSELLLGNAYPNPANTKATIPVLIPTTFGKTKLSLSIYDINGKHINTLADGIYAPGFYEFTWQMSDSNMQPVSGVFIYRLLFNNSAIAPIQKKLIVR